MTENLMHTGYPCETCGGVFAYPHPHTVPELGPSWDHFMPRIISDAEATAMLEADRDRVVESSEPCQFCAALKAKLDADTELRELVLKTLDEDTNMRLELIRIKQKVRELIMELMLPHTMLPSEVGDRLQAILDADPVAQPLAMLLFCPECGAQHIDAPDSEGGWTNPPHKSHLCAQCGEVWRAADICTTGVAAIKTRGANDTWPRLLARIEEEGE